MIISEFAQKAGVTVKTLLYYDKIGILKPSERDNNGYRIYSSDNLLRLQQILTLKFVGLSLDEIKVLLDKEGHDLSNLILLQREALNKKKRQIETVINVLEKAEAQMEIEGAVNVEQLIDIIKVTKMEKRAEWVQNYFTKDELLQIGERLYGNLTRGELENKALENDRFMEKIKSSLHLNPSSPKVQELAKRWKMQIEEFTHGDQELEKKLTTLYLEMDKMLVEFFNGWDAKMIKFMTNALKIYNDRLQAIGTLK